MDDLAAVEAAIYDQSFRALDEQARVLDSLRARAGALVAGASVATALLGGLASMTHSGKHARLDALTWAAIALFVVVLLLSLLVMTPWVNWVFSHHPHRLIAAYLNLEPPPSLATYRRTIAHYNGRHFDVNARQLRWLFRAVGVASVCLALELVLWLWILAR
jgi:hypothetical protein